MYTLGVDIGSTTSKAVILKDGKEIIASGLVVATVGTDGTARAVDSVLQQSGLEKTDISYTMATGYGRQTYDGADAQLSELSCHAAGMHFCFPEVRTVIDIGGQDAKVLHVNEQGNLVRFEMNDKCAAGTGRFLDVMAGILNLNVDQLGEKAAEAMLPVSISSTCTVFAESEVISQLAMGAKIPDLVAGICNSVAVRVASLAKRAGVTPPVAMSGGVARNAGVRNALANALGAQIHYSDKAQIMGALGAAIKAYEKVK